MQVRRPPVFLLLAQSLPLRHPTPLPLLRPFDAEKEEPMFAIQRKVLPDSS